MDIRSINQRDPYALAQTMQSERLDHGAEKRGTQAVAAGKADTVSLSEEGALRTEAYRSAMSSDDFRADKVQALKAQVDNGTYEVDSSRIAAKMLDEEAGL